MNQQRSASPQTQSPQTAQTLEWQAIPQSMLECMDMEQKLIAQEQGLAVFCAMRDEYKERWNRMESHRDVLGEAFSSLEPLWRRLWAEPQDPIQFVHKHYQASLQKLHEQSLALLQELQQSLQARSRVLGSWRNMIHEMSHRLHLLQKLDSCLEPLEAVVQQHLEEQHREESRRQHPNPSQQTQHTNISQAENSMGDTIETHVEEHDPAPQFSTTADPYEEQREHTRLVLGTVVNFGEDEHVFYTGFSENISEGGLFVATYAFQPRIGERFRLNFSLPHQTPIEVVGEVVWIRIYSPNNPNLSPGFGCRFLHISDTDKNDINAFIQQQGALFVPELSV